MNADRLGRWKRFSLRSLFVLMTVCCLLLSTWSLYVNPYWLQARSLAEVNRLQGQSSIEQADGPAWQRWLVTALLGADSFRHVTAVDLARRNVDDDALESLSGLTHLQNLSLDYTQITDRGIAALRSMKNLQQISLLYTDISDRSARGLSELPELRAVHLTGTKITDAAIPELAKQRTVSELWIRWTGISNAGADRLSAALPNCAVHHQALTQP